MKYSCRIAIYLLAVLMAGCATQAPIPDQEKAALWLSNKGRLEELESWQLKGRISVQVENEAWSATLLWNQELKDYLLRIIAPLGQGTIEINGNNDTVFMRTADNRLLQADKPETLMQEMFGWQVPVTGLMYWIRGLPEPNSRIDSLMLDNSGRVQKLSQKGWQLAYTSSISAGEYTLPRKISMQNKDIAVRIVIRDWDI